jgi:Ca2+-binding RTX toxin-like protein
VALRNFEVVIGTTDGDLIAGGKAAETLFGSGGEDFLSGGLGADSLTGGAGVDTFVYFSTKDSGVTRTTRDTITDFAGGGAVGGDTLDLSAIDADTKSKGNDAFNFIGANVGFSKAAGELRTVVQGPDLVLEGDTDGDGKADFSISLVGIAAIDAGDMQP